MYQIFQNPPPKKKNPMVNDPAWSFFYDPTLFDVRNVQHPITHIIHKINGLMQICLFFGHKIILSVGGLGMQ